MTLQQPRYLWSFEPSGGELRVLMLFLAPEPAVSGFLFGKSRERPGFGPQQRA